MNLARTAGFVAIVATLCVAAPSAQNPNDLPKGTGLIVGQVVDAESGRAIADVAVTPMLISKAPPPGTGAGGAGAVLTDAEGHFVFRGLVAGAYTVIGRRSGYVESAFGALRADAEGQPIVVADGGRVGGVSLKLWRYAVIGGTVTDDAGEPVIGVNVRAVRRALTAGQWRLGSIYTFENRTQTDDRGAYRISDLAPGDYVVVIEATTTTVPASLANTADTLRQNASQRDEYTKLTQVLGAIGASLAGPGSNRSVQVGDMVQSFGQATMPPSIGRGTNLMYQTQFYPASLAASRGQIISLKAGDERAGIDFAIKPVRSFVIRGIVTGAGGPLPNMPLHLVRADGADLLSEIDTAATISGPDGSFTFLGVPAGDYVVKAIRFPVVARMVTQVGNTTRSESGATSTSEPTYWAKVPVSVADAAVSDVAVTLNTGARLSGRVVFEGATPPIAQQLSGVTISMVMADGRRVGARLDESTVRMIGDTFVTPELPPGAYVLGVNGPARGGWTMASLTIAGRDLADTPINLAGRDISGITFTMTDKTAASLTGTLRSGANTSLSNATVFLFPADRSAWTNYGSASRRLRRARPAKTGTFTIESLPPGDYLAAAVADDAYPDWRDPKYLDALAKVASRVTIVASTAASVDLAVVRVPLPNRAPVAAMAAENTAAFKSRPPYGSIALTPDFGTVGGPYIDDAVLQQQPIRDAPAAPKPVAGTGVIAGKVVGDDRANAPLRRVVVTLNSTEPRVGRTAVTDDAGTFVFDQLPAGRYSVSLSKPGFITTSYGASKPGRPGTPVSLADGAKANLEVKLPRGAVITGVIRDERGQPMAGASAQAYEYAFSNGARSLTRVFSQSAPSDDRGVYRVFGLEAGNYIIGVDRLNVAFYRTLPRVTADDWRAAEREVATPSTSAPRQASSTLTDAGYVQTFYPGTPAVSEATLIKLGGGEERAGVDIAVPIASLARIRAKVTGADGKIPPTVQARLVPAVATPGTPNTNFEIGIFVPVSDGNVTVTGVPPGEYTLHVGGSSVPTPPPSPSGGGVGFSPDRAIGLPMWAMVPVTVTGRDVDLTVQLQPGYSVSGKIVFEGTAPPPAMTTLRPSLAGPRQGGVSLSTLFLPANATGEFKYDGLLPAAYRLQLAPPRGWTVKSAMMNGRDAADLPVDVRSDVSDVVITLTDKVARLSGNLQSESGAPAPDYFVIVFAKDPAYWLPASRRIVSVRPGTNGQFIVNALPPGDYLLAAVTDVESGEWFDPEFLKQLVSAAVPVTIAEGEQKVQDLRIK